VGRKDLRSSLGGSVRSSLKLSLAALLVRSGTSTLVREGSSAAHTMTMGATGSSRISL
jgi:hypothetical protein